MFFYAFYLIVFAANQSESPLSCDGAITSNLPGTLYLTVEENFGESSKGKGVKIDENRD